jgi:hypothetical protein
MPWPDAAVIQQSQDRRLPTLTPSTSMAALSIMYCSTLPWFVPCNFDLKKNLVETAV